MLKRVTYTTIAFHAEPIHVVEHIVLTTMQGIMQHLQLFHLSFRY